MNINEEIDLKSIPLRPAICLVARCARRVQPIIAFQDQVEKIQKADLAIRFAEWFAIGEHINLEAARVAVTALNQNVSTEDNPPGEFGNEIFYAQETARRAALSSAYAVDVIENSGLVQSSYEQAISIALETINYSIEASDSFSEQIGNDLRKNLYRRELVGSAKGIEIVKKDYNRLRELYSGPFVRLGSGIDPSEEGPLGEYWPQRPPDWYLTGLQSTRATLYGPDLIEVHPYDDSIVFDDEAAEKFICIDLDEFSVEMDKQKAFEKIVAMIERAHYPNDHYERRLVPCIIVLGSASSLVFEEGEETKRLSRLDRLTRAGAFFFEKDERHQSPLSVIEEISKVYNDKDWGLDLSGKTGAETTEPDFEEEFHKRLSEIGFTHSDHYIEEKPLPEDTGQDRTIYGGPPYTISREDRDRILERLRMPDDDWLKDD